MKVWIDVGGTFTDCFVSDAAGVRRSGKVLSSGVTKGSVAPESSELRIVDRSRRGDPDGFWVGFELTLIGDGGEPLESRRVAGFESSSGTFTLQSPLEVSLAAGEAGSPRAFELRSALEAPVLAVRRLLGLPLSEPLPPMEVRLGTTRGTNALLTRSGAAVALVTTRGFADLLRIGSQERPELFALDIHKPSPLTDMVLEIDERLDAEGQVLRPLDESVVRQQLEELRSRGAESLAICLLHAYRNDVHERAVERLAREVGFPEVSVSSEVVPLVKLLSRAETTVLDAYLNPILAGYIGRVWEQFGGPSRTRLRLMTSGGQLVGGEAFRGRDSILSGPAGGVVALAAIGRELAEVDQSSSGGVIGFDMGGTSTDVSRFEGRLVRQFESRKAGVRVMTPMMAIHTVAAGGGSVCYAEQGRLHVGPESAGSDPGPACYGRGGPLTVTDLNLVLGRVVEAEFPFPLDRAASLRRLDEVAADLARSGVSFPSREALAEGFWQIAVNHMAEAIRTVTTAEGADPRPMSLVGLGGAAGQHACAVAGSLGMRQVVDHPDAAMLSALGMGLAAVGRSATRGLYQTLDAVDSETIDAVEGELRAEVNALLAADLADEQSSHAAVEHRVTTEVRYAGTETTLELPLRPLDSLAERFAELHRSTFGYARANRPVELVTLRLEAEQTSDEPLGIERPEKIFPAEVKHGRATTAQPLFIGGEWISAALVERRELTSGAIVEGPAVIAAANSTLVVEPGWQATRWPDGSLVVTPRPAPNIGSELDARPDAAMEEAVQLEIVARRLEGIAEQMGEVLRRTSVSVNVKERLDYSCAVFREDGSLVAGAMHVPVHLGAMGHTVRSLMATYGEMFDGDCYVSNDPYAGGSHLPDVTVVTPVFVESRSGRPDFFVASRAHHAEIGGITPGSMPPQARSLAEEGVVIRNFALVRDSHDRESELEQLLTSGAYPSRTPKENLADIAAQVAAGRRGAADLVALARQHGVETLSAWMTRLLDMAADSVGEVLRRIGSQPRCFVDHLDDGTPIAVRIQSVEGLLQVDFEGTGAVHPHGWNATPAIVSAAVLYVLRCLAKRPLPLSEGVLQRIDLQIPSGLLNPPADEDPARCPAVVAGNVETSQRIVDALLGALGAAAASQGTMNNLLIGDATFGYYETICGGAGATAEASGADAVHTHMTNTRITDPEILESRYPIRLWRFAVRRGSGGAGRRRGGDGVIRELEMLRPLTVSLLTGRRGEYRPYGIAGGQPGAAGQNRMTPAGGSEQVLPNTVQLDLQCGDRLTIETPGGGGWGEPS
ncbi:hydantoinase B/oxoprolinase family protein [Candidatus Laterigemmans baculatus]|uniref:hydantoinase B/oxoprolinase family protein n=1 Tax=Candidatus Laterigemmans baculatus TaxID=2770505 RepID=UPI001F25EF0B|nr:hydantoinase B/oxoprolinase family protein [Candidatus Laterigemmans baculatus]